VGQADVFVTVREVIDRYHALVTGPLGRESAHAFRAGMLSARLTFGDRPICQVLRPFFLTSAEASMLKADAEQLAGAFRKVLAALERDPGIRRVLALSEEEEALLAADRQPFEPDQIARLDGFLVRGGPFRAIEYNAESPGGIAFGDGLAALFRDLPIMHVLAREHAFSTYDGLSNTLAQLRRAHETRIGREAVGPLRIAVVDWKSAPTRREFEMCAEYFTRQGCPSAVVQPDEFHYDAGRLTAGGVPIDVVYKRVLAGDLVRNGGVNHPLVRAVRDGAVTCASRFQVHLLYRKELFALFRDERLAGSFTDAERDVIRRIIPWSRIVEDVDVDDGGRPARLFDLIRRRREQLVLKPTNQYGGKGVVLGWLATDAQWEQALVCARAEPYLVQERVELPSERFPVMDGDAIAFADFYADINPYIWGGVRSEGFGARLAPGELLNVTAGGGSAVPVFVVD
jgi:hypothetical protein